MLCQIYPALDDRRWAKHATQTLYTCYEVPAMRHKRTNFLHWRFLTNQIADGTAAGHLTRFHRNGGVCSKCQLHLLREIALDDQFARYWSKIYTVWHYTTERSSLIPHRIPPRQACNTTAVVTQKMPSYWYQLHMTYNQQVIINDLYTWRLK